MNREARLVEAFVEMADTLVDDFDVVDLLQRLVEHCVALLAADAAGLLLADQRGGLQVVACSTEQARLLELYQLQNDEGPCLDCFHTGKPVLIADISSVADRWPHFSLRALADGYHSVHAVPLRLRAETIGAMNLFHSRVGSLPDEDLTVGQALADVATIGILQERMIRHGETLSEQLQTALNSRVIIEQAKGVLAQSGSLDMDAAFAQLRGYARNHNERLAEVARRLVDGTMNPAQILAPSPALAPQAEPS